MALPTKSPVLRGGPPGRPRLLGRYHVLDEMGRNAVGPLYLARLEGPKGFQRWAAIRKVDKLHLLEEGYVQRFYERVREGAKLLHPNVTALFDVGEDDGAPWVAMEYLHGERIEEAIERLELAETPASWEIAARIIADAADGLHAVHSLRDKDGTPLGLLHGDLAPHTLIVTYEGKTKIKGAFEPRAHGVLDPRKVPYAAPEQLFGGEADARADVFALGVLLWELLAGRRLFARATQDETRAMIESGVVPPLGDIVEELPPDLDGLVKRALQRDPEERFVSAKDLSRELESLLVAQGVVARDDDVGRYMRTLFADRYKEEEAKLQAAAEVTEVFRRSQQGLSARSLAILPDLSFKGDDEDAEETELITAPRSHNNQTEDEDRTTAERPASRRKDVLADSGPTNPRQPPLHDTDEVPTVTAPQAPMTAPLIVHTTPTRQHPEDERTLTAARLPSSSYSGAGPAPQDRSNSRLIMPSSLQSEPDITESAIFVAPRPKPPTPPEGAHTPTPPPRPLMPSLPDRPLLPSTPQGGVPAPPVRKLPTAPWPVPFPAAPAFNVPAATGGEHRAMSTTSLRAVLFPPDRKKRIFVMSVLGALAGVILFLLFLVHVASQPKTKATAVVPPKPTQTKGATNATPTPTPLPPRSATAAPSATIPAIPVFELQPASSSQHHRGGHQQHTQQATVTTTTASPPPPPPPPPSTKSGFLTVMCKPACDHVLDGARDLGETPLLRHEMSSGKHVLTLRIDASRTQKTVTVDVPEGENVTIHPDLSQ